MGLGTAVFISSALIAVVLLYGFTKDRWSWRRLVLRSLAGVIALAIVIAAVTVAVQYWDRVFPENLGRQTEYDGLRLGMSRDEVRYIKGNPTWLVSKDVNEGSFGRVKTSEIPKEKSRNDYPAWEYETEYELIVGFDKANNVQSIGCFVSTIKYRCPTIGGVRDGTSETELLRRFGAPNKSEIESGYKSIEYDGIGVVFRLEKEKVFLMRIGKKKVFEE